MMTGALRWSTSALPFDAWTVDSLPFFEAGPTVRTSRPDYDFGQRPPCSRSRRRAQPGDPMVGAGQKSGQYWAMNPTPVRCGG